MTITTKTNKKNHKFPKNKTKPNQIKPKQQPNKQKPWKKLTASQASLSVPSMTGQLPALGNDLLHTDPLQMWWISSSTPVFYTIG